MPKLGAGLGVAASRPQGSGGSPPIPLDNTYSVDFDGINDYVIASVDGTATGAFGSGGAKELTISFWFKLSATPTQQGLFQWANALTSGTPMLLIVTTTTQIKFYNGLYRTLSGTLSTGTWYHFALTRTASDNTWRSYLNGVANTTTDDGGTITHESYGQSIYSMNGYGGYASGNMDEFAMWTVALDADAITAIYNSGVPTDLSTDSGDYDNSSSLYAWYRMGDGDTHPTLTDNGSGGNDGTMTNMSQADIVQDVPMIAVQEGLTFNIDCLDTNSYPGTGTVWTSTVNATNIGTLNGDVNLTGGHMHFDGANDYVEIVTTSNSITSDPFTIEVWLRATTSSHDAVFGNTTEALRNGFYCKNHVTNLYVYGMTSGAFYRSSAISTGVWYQFIITIDGTTINTYRNSILLTSGGNDGAGGFVESSTSPFFLANDSTGGSDFEGDIDIVRMYDRVLTTAEIEHNFEAYRDRFGL